VKADQPGELGNLRPWICGVFGGGGHASRSGLPIWVPIGGDPCPNRSIFCPILLKWQ
jgi:hypothetical protein